MEQEHESTGASPAFQAEPPIAPVEIGATKDFADLIQRLTERLASVEASMRAGRAQWERELAERCRKEKAELFTQLYQTTLNGLVVGDASQTNGSASQYAQRRSRSPPSRCSSASARS